MGDLARLRIEFTWRDALYPKPTHYKSLPLTGQMLSLSCIVYDGPHFVLSFKRNEKNKGLYAIKSIKNVRKIW